MKYFLFIELYWIFAIICHINNITNRNKDNNNLIANNIVHKMPINTTIIYKESSSNLYSIIGTFSKVYFIFFK